MKLHNVLMGFVRGHADDDLVKALTKELITVHPEHGREYQRLQTVRTDDEHHEQSHHHQQEENGEHHAHHESHSTSSHHHSDDNHSQRSGSGENNGNQSTTQDTHNTGERERSTSESGNQSHGQDNQTNQPQNGENQNTQNHQNDESTNDSGSNDGYWEPHPLDTNKKIPKNAPKELKTEIDHEKHPGVLWCEILGDKADDKFLGDYDRGDPMWEDEPPTSKIEKGHPELKNPKEMYFPEFHELYTEPLTNLKTGSGQVITHFDYVHFAKRILERGAYISKSFNQYEELRNRSFNGIQDKIERMSNTQEKWNILHCDLVEKHIVADKVKNALTKPSAVITSHDRRDPLGLGGTAYITWECTVVVTNLPDGNGALKTFYPTSNNYKRAFELGYNMEEHGPDIDKFINDHDREEQPYNDAINNFVIEQRREERQRQREAERQAAEVERRRQQEAERNRRNRQNGGPPRNQNGNRNNNQRSGNNQGSNQHNNSQNQGQRNNTNQSSRNTQNQTTRDQNRNNQQRDNRNNQRSGNNSSGSSQSNQSRSQTTNGSNQNRNTQSSNRNQNQRGGNQGQTRNQNNQSRNNQPRQNQTTNGQTRNQSNNSHQNRDNRNGDRRNINNGNGTSRNNNDRRRR